MKENKGFSLVELIIVIAIMAILIGVLAPQYIKYVERSRESKDENVAAEIYELASVIAADVDYMGKINAGDKIQFNSAGVSSNSDVITQQILPRYMPGFENVRMASKKYANMTYTMEFVIDPEDNKLAVQVGWQ